MTRKLFFFLSFVSGSLFVTAQDTSKITTLEEVTVTATRSQQSVLTTPRSVTVITAADIQKQPYQNVADLLQRYEGIFVPGTFQTPGANQTLYMRGADNKQNLVMIDGVRLSDASTPDNGIDLNEVSLNNVERIEIVRGSQGTLYGGSAVGGVINIITKKNAHPGFSGMIKENAGTFGNGTFLNNAQVGLAYSTNSGFYIRSEVLNTHSDGFNSSVRRPTAIIPEEKDKFNKTDYSGKIGYSNAKWDVYGGYRRTDQKADIDDGAFNDDENNVLKFNRDLYTYGLGYKLSNSTAIKAFGGYTTTERKNHDDSSVVSLSPLRFDGAVLDATYTGRNLTNELQFNYNRNHFSLVVGGGFIEDKMNTNVDILNTAFNFTSKTSYDTVGISMNTAFGYAHGRYAIPFAKEGHALNLAGGVRYSRNNRFGNYVSYEFTPSLQVGRNVTVFAGYSTGYNAPSLYQLFAPERDFTSQISRGNISLKAEESRNIELGVKAIANGNINLRVSAYYNEVKNYIDFVYLWNGSVPADNLTFNDYRGDTYLNVGKQINRGLEAGVDVNLSEKWELHTNVSYNIGKINYSPSSINNAKTNGNQVQLYSNGAFLNSDVTSDSLVRRPAVISNTSVVFKPTTKWRIAGDVRSVEGRQDVSYNPNLGPFGALGRNFVNSFVLFNLSAQYYLSQKLSIGINSFNIFNKTYSELSGFQTRGRSVFGTVHFTF